MIEQDLPHGVGLLLAEMSPQQKAADWLHRASAMPEIDHFVATPSTKQLIGNVRHDFDAGQKHARDRGASQQDLDAQRRQFDQETIQPMLGADSGVVQKNRLLAGLFDEVEAGHEDNPVFKMLVGLREGAGELFDGEWEVNNSVYNQFRALWIVKTEL